MLDLMVNIENEEQFMDYLSKVRHENGTAAHDVREAIQKYGQQINVVNLAIDNLICSVDKISEEKRVNMMRYLAELQGANRVKQSEVNGASCIFGV